ncbi:MAG: GAF domain-containing protein [Solirubrobacterales bacterium]|nr:GAF domain-containing protein [Solirubrobacterales bacterium]
MTAERAEQRYIALASLARRLTSARDPDELTAATAQALGDCEPATVRLWGMTADGLREVGRTAGATELPEIAALDLRRAATADRPTVGPEACLLMGVQADGVSFGVLEVHDLHDGEVVEAAAPLIACRLSMLANQGVSGVQLLPAAVADASDASSVIAGFARQAKRLLDHDRLSVYLVSHDGRAFERFAVATSTIVPGEGVLIPFEDVGLRHIVLNNRPIVSSDLGADPRLIGAEDRVIARAGFHGLLSVPLRHDGRPFGVLNFVSRKAGFYRQEDVPIAEQIADQIAAFVENLRLQQRMQGFVRQEASERERTRLVRDLYQAVAQAVPQISAAASEIERAAADDESPTSDNAVRIRDIAEQGLADMRRAIVDLDPPGLESGGLAEMIARALERFREQADCETDLRLDGDVSAVPGDVASTAYRVLQEALMNVRLHAAADEVTVQLNVDRGLVLTVEDDGIGFDTREAIHGEGLGLRHMRERTDTIGGFLTVQSDRRNGTAIRLNVPDMREARDGRTVIPRGPNGDEPQEGTLRVFVAEANVLLRGGMCRLIEAGGEMRVVGEADSREQLRGQLRQLHPDVVVLSTTLANGELERLVVEARKASPSTELLAVSHGDVGRDAELIEWGVTGVVHLPVDPQRLTEAVRAVACGTHVLGGPPDSGDQGRAEMLTGRERSILALVAVGQTNSQIGGTLFLATKTVERQVATIVRKLNAHNRAHAAAIGVARRIIEMPGESV